MRTYRQPGLTLIEALVSISVIAIVLFSVLAITFQSSAVYQRTAARQKSQAAQVLALKRIAAELREAKSVSVSSTSTAMLITLPQKDSTTHMVTILSGTSGPYVPAGATIRYFLGTKSNVRLSGGVTHWDATPSDTGDTLFRIDNSVAPVGGVYADAPIVIEGIVTSIPNGSGTPTPQRIFVYGPTDTTTPSSNDVRLVKVTLTMPFTEVTPVGKSTVYQSLSTQLYMRNLGTTQQG